MLVDDDNPAPIVIPDDSFETVGGGILLNAFDLFNPSLEEQSDVAYTNENIGDGISYVSGIKTCKESESSTTIVGLQFTMTSSTSGN